jgi:hypothetical protein
MPKITNQETLDFNIHIEPINGKPGLLFKKHLTICEQNELLIHKILESAFEGKTITANIRVLDKTKALARLKELGIKVVKN